MHSEEKAISRDSSMPVAVVTNSKAWEDGGRLLCP
jgi:hypothetical protein